MQNYNPISTTTDHKTGTLTKGELVVTDVVSSNARDVPLTKTDILRLAASAERGSEHPLAQVVIQQHNSLNETEGGCALWTEREWVRSLPPPKESITIPIGPLGSKYQ